jgi:hypothetical protein
VVTLRTTTLQFNISTFLPTEWIYGVYVDLRTNIESFHYTELAGLCKREEKCLLRRKNWVFKNNSNLSEILILISHHSGLSLHPWLKELQHFVVLCISFRTGSLSLYSNVYSKDVRVTRTKCCTVLSSTLSRESDEVNRKLISKQIILPPL